MMKIFRFRGAGSWQVERALVAPVSFGSATFHNFLYSCSRVDICTLIPIHHHTLAFLLLSPLFLCLLHIEQMPYYQLGAFSGGESFLFLLFCTAGFKFNCFRNWYGARIMRMWFQESRWGRVGRCMKTQIILVFERSFFIGPQTQSFLPLTLPQVSQGPLCAFSFLTAVILLVVWELRQQLWESIYA